MVCVRLYIYFLKLRSALLILMGELVCKEGMGIMNACSVCSSRCFTVVVFPVKQCFIYFILWKL